MVADPTRLAQVILNLLNNSAKYTEEGGRISLAGRATGSSKRSSGSATTAWASLPNYCPRVFELFTQAERTIDRSQGGLGIGLTIVRRLVEMQGGSVEAHSEGPGRGSEFVFKIAVAAAHQRDRQVRRARNQPSEKPQSSARARGGRPCRFGR